MSQHYIGIKQVFAWPEEKSGEAGYHVVYRYGQPDAYHSWSPKAEFERFYLPQGNDPTRVTQAMVDGFVAKCEPATVGGKMTVCSVELANGTLYAESSACVDPASYDEAVGKGICLDRAKDRVWHLLGFALQWARRGLPPAAAAIVAVMLLAGHVAAADLGSPIPIDKQVAELRADVDALKRDVAEIKGKPATASPPTWAGVRDRVAAGETVWIAVGVAPRLGDVALPARADVHPARHKCYRDAAGVERFECEDGRPSLVASRRVATAAPVMGPTFANPFGGPPSGCPGGNCAAPAGRLGRRW